MQTLYRVNLLPAALVSILSLFAFGCLEDSKSREPDVFLFVIDTLRADRLGGNGDQPSITPNIDRFAQQSFRYERAYAQSSWTKTSMASLLTGVYPYRHGVFSEEVEGGRLPDAAETLAEILQARGYRTTAISSNPHIQHRTGFAQGFDTFLHSNSWQGETTELLSGLALEQLAKADREQRQFFYFHYLDPHDPWRCTPEQTPALPKGNVINPWVREGEPYVLSGEAKLGTEKLLTGILPVPVELKEDELTHLRGLYDCEISLVDRWIGEVLTQLEREGWLDTSIVIITSDHGEEFLDHGMLRHGYQLFDETIHVPLLIRTPGHRAPAVFTDGLVELVDIVPSILSLLPSPPSLELDGEVLPGIGSESPHDKPSRAFGMTGFRRQHKAFVISGDSKLVWDFKLGRGSLFDLSQNNRETTEQDPNSSPEGRRLIQELNDWKTASEKGAYLIDQKPRDTDPVEDELLRRQLKELGYVE